jgi:hypothetical protein
MLLYADYVQSNVKMIREWWFEKDVEGDERDLMAVESRYICLETEENHERTQFVQQMSRSRF